MISYHGQAIVSFSARAGQMLGIQSRRIEIGLEETAPGVFNLTCGLNLRGAEEVRITLPERQHISGTVAVQEGQVVTLVATGQETAPNRPEQARHQEQCG